MRCKYAKTQKRTNCSGVEWEKVEQHKPMKEKQTGKRLAVLVYCDVHLCRMLSAELLDDYLFAGGLIGFFRWWVA